MNTETCTELMRVIVREQTHKRDEKEMNRRQRQLQKRERNDTKERTGKKRKMGSTKQKGTRKRKTINTMKDLEVPWTLLIPVDHVLRTNSGYRLLLKYIAYGKPLNRQYVKHLVLPLPRSRDALSMNEVVQWKDLCEEHCRMQGVNSDGVNVLQAFTRNNEVQAILNHLIHLLSRHTV